MRKSYELVVMTELLRYYPYTLIIGVGNVDVYDCRSNDQPMYCLLKRTPLLRLLWECVLSTTLRRAQFTHLRYYNRVPFVEESEEVFRNYTISEPLMWSKVTKSSYWVRSVVIVSKCTGEHPPPLQSTIMS